MKIILTGVETNNKGAELMLYAILQEIERLYPDANVYINYNSITQGIDYVKTNLQLKYWPLSRFYTTCHIPGIFRRLHLNYEYVEDVRGIRHADYLLDGSGFAFSDVWNFDKIRIWKWKKLLSYHKEQGCKIVFLPQAFGPFCQDNTKEVMTVVSKSASLIMPRDQVSFNYLQESGIVDMTKVQKFTDFTSLVKGYVPKQYEHLRDGICVIPNMRMVDKGAITLEAYKNFLKEIVIKGKSSGHAVYLLNHEGSGDEKLAYTLQDMLNHEIEVVTNLNALEVKGLISASYVVITSRFHGAASALNSCVPCLATSWSHKYQELFKDYEIEDGVLPLNDLKKALAKITEYIESQNNDYMRKKLEIKVPEIMEETRRMWSLVWGL